MEVVGSTAIFQQSIGKHNLRYTKYLGHSFEEAQNSYEGKDVEKLEYVGHAQKHVETRLCDLKKKDKRIGWKREA